MGIVHRQSSKFSIVSIVALVLGVVNILYVYPEFLELYGFTQGVLSLVVLVIPISQFGLQSILLRYSGILKNENVNETFRFALMWTVVSALIFGSGFIIFNNEIAFLLKKISTNYTILSDYKWQILILILLSGLTMTLSTISTIKKRITIPNIIKNLISQKVLLPVLIILVAVLKLEVHDMLLVLIIREVVVLGVLYIYCYSQHWLSLSSQIKLSIDQKKDIGSFGMYSILNESSNTLAFSIDIVMVNILLGDTATGIYSIFVFLTNALKIPINSIGGIMMPIIASLWSKNDIDGLHDYYKRTSITLLSVTLGGFILVQSSLEDLLTFLGKLNLLPGMNIFWILSIGVIVNAATALNGSIIIQGKYYRWNLIFTLLLGLLNLFLTYYFIVYVFEVPNKFIGASVSTIISLIMINVFKTIFLYSKLGIHPFSLKTMQVLLIGIVTFIAAMYLPTSGKEFLDIILRSIFIFLFYLGGVYKLKISPDINQFINKNVKVLSKK